MHGVGFVDVALAGGGDYLVIVGAKSPAVFPCSVFVNLEFRLASPPPSPGTWVFLTRPFSAPPTGTPWYVLSVAVCSTGQSLPGYAALDTVVTFHPRRSLRSSRRGDSLRKGRSGIRSHMANVQSALSEMLTSRISLFSVFFSDTMIPWDNLNGHGTAPMLERNLLSGAKSGDCACNRDQRLCKK